MVSSCGLHTNRAGPRHRSSARLPVARRSRAVVSHATIGVTLACRARARRPAVRVRAGGCLLAACLAIGASGCGSHSRPAGERARPERAAGAWSTWVLSSPAAVRVPPPPAPRSRAARDDAAGLRALAGARTPAETADIRRASRRPAVEPWVELDMRLERVPDPLAVARVHALLSVAMYDATVAAWHWKYVYRRPAPEAPAAAIPPGPDPSYPSEHATIAGAASRVLTYAFPEARALGLDAMAERAAGARVRAGVNYPSDVRAGLALGRKVAEAVIARARRDRSTLEWDGRRPHGRAHWEPPPGSVGGPLEPMAGRWRTWVLASGSQVRPGPPPRFGSPRFLAEAREVMQVRDHVTPEQERIVSAWAGGIPTTLPPTVWDRIALASLSRPGLSIPRQARALALVDAAIADAGIAAWDTKYAYWSPRPENAIDELGLQAGWAPLIPTPRFPSYVSGHATFSGAASEVLAHLFPAQAPVFRARAREAAMSRLWGGIHFRTDNAVGLRMGRQIGRLAVARARRDGAQR
jgi:membrane-associated phospholipid phosphatase